VLTNPTLKFTGDIYASKLYPSPLPDLFKGEQLVLVGRYSGQGDSAIVVEGSVNGESRKLTYEVKFGAENSESDFIPRLWATRRVGYLLDEIRLHGENSELREETTELARKYGIVTPYTAYLIVEDEAQRNVNVLHRSFQGLDKDGAVRHEAAQAWDSFKRERGGDQAVGGARFNMELKSANGPAPAAQTAAVESRRSLGIVGYSGSGGSSAPSVSTAPASLADQSRERLVDYSQNSQFVGDKNFFQNGNQWIDSAVQKSPNAKPVRIQFGSSDYFDFVSKHPEAAPWLALGQNIKFVLKGTVYEIYE
jgi:Ca-activated chloride channel family protein